MSRPPWGKVAGECLTEGGELAYRPRLRPNQRIYPNHHRATNPYYPRKTIQPRKRAPPFEP